MKPKFSKRHYEDIAKDIAIQFRKVSNEYDTSTATAEELMLRAAGRVAIIGVVNELAWTFSLDNRNFDIGKFRAACGLNN